MAQRQSMLKEVWDIITGLVLCYQNGSNSDIVINPIMISVANVLSIFVHPGVGTYKLHALSMFQGCNPNDLLLYNSTTKSINVYTPNKYLIRSILMP